MENNQYIGRDRRKFKRLRVRLAVIYRLNQPLAMAMQIAGREIIATVVDLSEGGMAIFTDYDIPLQTDLWIKFTLFMAGKLGEVTFYGPMEIIGEVRSNNSSDNGMRRLGIVFRKIEDRDRAEIAKFIKLSFEK